MKKTFLIVLILFAGIRPLCAGEPIQSDSRYRKIDKVYTTDGALFSETDLFSDKYNGFYKTYHKNGKLATEIRYQDGWQIYDAAFDEAGMPIIRNGVFKTFYATGDVASTGEYKYDLKNGTETFYYYDGKTVVDVWHYMYGRRVGWHTRNDTAGNFVSREDWGYPTYYVESLKVIIYGQIFIILLGALALYRYKHPYNT